MTNNILLQDFKFIKEKVFSDESFNDSTFLITGATGLIGSLIVKSILYVNATSNANIRILAQVRDIEKAKEIFGEVKDLNLTFLKFDLLKPISDIGLKNIDFIIHTASITNSKEMVDNPVGVLLTAIESTKNLLEYMKESSNKSKMIYISSMEYYGQIIDEYNNVTEDKLGYLDMENIRSCYPESKRVCEMLCKAYFKQYNINVCNVRLAQTFGAGVHLSDNRVFSQFAKSVLNNQDIILHTHGYSEGNYCYTADAIHAIFLILLRGKSGQSYNVSHSHSSIINMARMVAKNIAKNRISVRVSIPESSISLGYAPDVKLKLNSDKLQALGWKAEVNLEDMFRRLLESWDYKG